MAINGYHHIGLMVRDVDKSLAFYTEGLGGKVTMSFPMGDTGKTIYMVDLGGNATVELLPQNEIGTEANARWAHIAVTSDDVRADCDTAIKAGAVVKSEPRDLVLGETACCNAFVYGPDGESIEFFQVK